MTINTRDFGKIEILESEILEFKLPILGFEAYTKFVMLYDDEMGQALCWLQSVSDADVCFILADPALADESYCPALPAEALCALQLQPKDAVYRVLTVIPQNPQDATVNLKSPVVINPHKKLAGQVVLEDNYPLKAMLMPQEDTTC
ncbi:MAG: flagellar assembly protein FliW [Oscillospiraceae bacterium]|nr:flagellar assembly protein FliW [Oscillospiraceae bacterium]